MFFVDKFDRYLHKLQVHLLDAHVAHLYIYTYIYIYIYKYYILYYIYIYMRIHSFQI